MGSRIVFITTGTLEYSEREPAFAMPKTRLRGGHIVIEAWFRGY